MPDKQITLQPSHLLSLICFTSFNKLTASFVPALSISTSLAMKLSIHFTKIDIIQKSKPLLILFTILLNSTLSVCNITLSVLRCQAGKHHATYLEAGYSLYFLLPYAWNVLLYPSRWKSYGWWMKKTRLCRKKNGEK